MAKFTAMKPEEVAVGRGRGAAIAREPYIAALADAQAGRVDLERGERAATAKRLLQDASKIVGVRIRSTYVEKENAILWKRVGA